MSFLCWFFRRNAQGNKHGVCDGITRSNTRGQCTPLKCLCILHQSQSQSPQLSTLTGNLTKYCMHQACWDTEVAERTDEQTRLHKNRHHKSIENLIQTHAPHSVLITFFSFQACESKDQTDKWQRKRHISCVGLSVDDTLGAKLMFSFHGRFSLFWITTKPFCAQLPCRSQYSSSLLSHLLHSERAWTVPHPFKK